MKVYSSIRGLQGTYRSVILALFIVLVLTFTCVKNVSSQSFPSGVVSATISTSAPTLGSPKSETVITLKMSSITDFKNVHLSIVNPSDSVLFSQAYDVGRIAIYSLTGGYKLMLKFFSDLDLSTNPVKIRFEDKSGSFGSAFTVIE